MNRLIIVGSPRTNGRSAHLANMLFETCIEECPDDELALAPVSTLDVGGCTGCDACRDNIAKLVELGEEALDDDFAPCVIDDDMQEIYELIDSADEITVVSPVYFAGPPSQLKALLDRLQPYYWTNARVEEKRPAVLHVVGEGGDPHGFDPLVGTVRSAAAVAGFRLERVLDWVGKIDESGEIVAEADEYPISGPVVRAFAGGASAAAVEPVEAPAEQPAAPAESAPEAFEENDFAAQLASQAARRQQRARLDLGENGSERQVIKLDEEGRRVDAAQHGRKRSAQKKHANAKRGTNGVQQAKHDNPHAQKGKGGGKAGGAKGGNANRGGKQGKRRG